MDATDQDLGSDRDQSRVKRNAAICHGTFFLARSFQMKCSLSKLCFYACLALFLGFDGVAAQTIEKSNPATVPLSRLSTNLALYLGNDEASYLSNAKAPIYSQLMAVVSSVLETARALPDGTMLLTAHLKEHPLVRAAIIYSDSGEVQSAALLRPQCSIKNAPENLICDDSSNFVLTIFSNSSDLPSQTTKNRFKSWSMHSIIRIMKQGGASKELKNLTVQVHTPDNS